MNENPEDMCTDDSWLNLAVVGTHVSNQSSFDPRNYSHAKLSTLVDTTDLFDLQRRQNGIYVKDKREAKGARPQTPIE